MFQSKLPTVASTQQSIVKKLAGHKFCSWATCDPTDL